MRPRRRAHASAALALPLLTPASCAGVLTLEFARGSEATGSVRAGGDVLRRDARAAGRRHADPQPESPRSSVQRRRCLNSRKSSRSAAGSPPSWTGARFERVTLRRPDLRIPFPRRFAARLTGATVLALTRRAKYLVAELSSGETLVMHLGMSGSFRVDRAAPATPDRHDHVIFEMSNGAVVTFNDPRRFGFMDLLTPRRLAAHPALSALGPEPLSDAFDAAALAAACGGQEDLAQGGAPRSARRRRPRQHLRRRSAAPRGTVAAAGRGDDCDAGGQAASRGPPPERGDQRGPAWRRWRVSAAASTGASGFASTIAKARRAWPAAAAARFTPHPDRPFDLLLPRLPALAAGLKACATDVGYT